jgi:hypothetical protein
VEVELVLVLSVLCPVLSSRIDLLGLVDGLSLKIGADAGLALRRLFDGLSCTFFS